MLSYKAAFKLLMGAVSSLSRIQLLTGGGPEALRFSRTQLLSLQTSLRAAHVLTATREGERGPKTKANLLHPNLEADFCHIQLLRKKLASSAHIQWKELHKGMKTWGRTVGDFFQAGRYK